jgi:hypothetical protein
VWRVVVVQTFVLIYTVVVVSRDAVCIDYLVYGFVEFS